MSRDANGNYTLPVGNPVVTDTVIESDWANGTMGDIKTEMTNSLDRQGRGGMLAPVKGVDGSKTTPAYSYTNEFNSGWYRADDGDHRFSLEGVDAFRMFELDSDNNPLLFKLFGGDVEYKSGVYKFDGVGLELSGTDLYIGDAATGVKVIVEGSLSADDIAFDKAITGVLSANNVQEAIDQLTAGAQTYSSVPQTGGATLITGVMNELLDGSTFKLPLANTTQVNAQIGISVPDTAAAFKPFVERTGTDLISYRDGTDTDMKFNTPATIWLTSNGVDTWRY